MTIFSFLVIIMTISVSIIGIINIHTLNKIKKRTDYSRIKVYEKYKVITLCGSTQFKEEFLQVQKELTLRGHIVFSVGCFGHSGDTEVWDYNNKRLLDDIHKRKIDLSSSIMVINKDGYIGESTKSEIEYAKSTGKKVFYWY